MVDYDVISLKAMVDGCTPNEIKEMFKDAFNEVNHRVKFNESQYQLCFKNGKCVDATMVIKIKNIEEE